MAAVGICARAVKEAQVLKIGVSLPSTDLGGDPVVLRDYAQAAEAIGFDHLALYDHVLGVNPASRPDWKGPYTSRHAFHDPFVLMGYLAGQTSRIVLTTHILILAQRQTVLVARQAASVDQLAGGRLRLGIGTGWNPLEYVALGEDFGNRGRRSEEQITLLKALWTEPHVDFEGSWHKVPDTGLNPRPAQAAIPIWLGGHAAPVLRRIATMGDGWIIIAYSPDEVAAAEIGKLRDFTREAGRADDAVGIDAWVSMGAGGPDEWRAEIAAWRDLGLSHVTLNTAFTSYHHQRIAGSGLDDHLAAIGRYHEAVADLL
jgi:probable F420-dependent oxidoreductase